MGCKSNALFLDLPQGGQTEHLKATGIGKDRSIPSHKLVEASALFHHLITRAQMQMVGITEFDLTANVFQILCA